MKNYSADFETCTWLDDETYVWAYAICDIDDTENIIIGNNITDFIEFLKNSRNSTFWFHNEKFDGEFIIYYLLKNGYKHLKDNEKPINRSFQTLITNMGIFYSITIYFEVGNKQVKKATIYDSLKVIGLSVEDTAKAYNLPISKLKIDYNAYRKKGHILTTEEREYIKNDVKIVAIVLKQFFKEGLTHMTAASNALHDYKDIMGIYTFESLFPELNPILDADLRKAYKGGFTYLNPIYKDKEIKNINVLDVNSLYPSVMYFETLPFGEPIFFEGEYKEDKAYPLYIVRITCSFEVKKNFIPTIQIKNSRDFIENEYLTTSYGEIVALTLTNIDLELFLKHYEVYDLKYICGWKFRGKKGMFKDYIDKWIAKKNEGTITKNKGKRTIAKKQLNSLYGKFATTLKAQQKSPYLEDDIVKYKIEDEEEKKGVYLPVGAFITAYARRKTITTSQIIKEYSINKYGYDAYIYSDTDSIHTTLSIEELEKVCDIDDVKLGFWANEEFCERGKYIRQKCYIHEVDSSKNMILKTKYLKINVIPLKDYKSVKFIYFLKSFKGEICIKNNIIVDRVLEVTIAGMPSKLHKNVTWENFKEGFTCGGKLTFKHVKGGVKLVETEYTIKYDKKKDLFKVKNL